MGFRGPKALLNLHRGGLFGSSAFLERCSGCTGKKRNRIRRCCCATAGKGENRSWTDRAFPPKRSLDGAPVVIGLRAEEDICVVGAGLRRGLDLAGGM